MKIKVHGGLKPEIQGPVPGGDIEDAKVDRIALLGSDYPVMLAKLLVAQGDLVNAGTAVFEDRRRPGIVVSSPVSGRIEKIVIGAKRHLTRVEIAVEGDEQETFVTEDTDTCENVRALMYQSGLWPAFRSRPFDRVPDVSARPAAIFVTATDTHPLAPNPFHVLAGQEAEFARGVAALKCLTAGKVYVCQGPGTALASEDSQTVVVIITGYHPAGLAGTHIAQVHPASQQSPVWHIGYQDVAAVGQLLLHGRFAGKRTITLAGPGITRPVLLRVPMGADLHMLTRGKMSPGQKRILSGAAIGGRESQYLSRYHVQATVLDRPPERVRNWLIAALRQASAPAAFIPTQALERSLQPGLHVVPLLRALSIGDTESAERLGCLQLAEEDLALASYAAGGEVDFGARLRAVLNTLEAS